MGKQTLFIAAGHGGDDKGNTTTGLVERDLVIDVVNMAWKWYQIAEELKREPGGVVVIDHQKALAGEIADINAWKPDSGDLALNVHLDYKAGSRGALCLVDREPRSVAWAKLFLERWCKLTKIPSRGVHDSQTVAPSWRGWSDFGFCAAPRFPGVIVELGCLNSAEDMAVIRDPVHQILFAHCAWQAWTKTRAL